MIGQRSSLFSMLAIFAAAVIMAALRMRCGRYIFVLFLSSFFFFFLA